MPQGSGPDVPKPQGVAGRTDRLSSDLIGILDTLDVPIVVLTRDVIVDHFNRSATALLHLTPSDIGRPVRDVRILTNQIDLEKLCAQAIADGVPSRHDIRDGDRWFLLRVAPYTRSDGQIGGAVLTLANVTAFRRGIEQAVHERESAKAILNTVSTPLVVLDAHLKVRTGNRAFYSMFQVSREHTQEVLLHHLLKYDPDGALGRLLTETLAGKSGGRTIELEHDFPTIGRRTVLFDARPFSRESDPDMILLALQDITDRKRAEEELVKVSKLESIGVLAGGIAHDFNNLLTAIVGNLYLSKTSLDPGNTLYTHLVQAEKACVRAQSLTQQLLTFARGGVPVMKTCAIGHSLEEWVTFALRGSNVEPRFAVPSDLWSVEADEGQLSQVINNLVINAQQAMASGGTLRVAAANLVLSAESGLPLPPGRYVCISVADSGVGIPHEHLPRVFDPFFTTKTKGSGLGLTTAFAIVHKHQGHLTLESEPGKGTTCFVYLPSSTKTIGSAKGLSTVSFPGEGTILFMDDEEAIRDFMGELLRDAGYDVECVSDGADAVKRYREALQAGQRFDVVILDLTVPGGLGGKDTLDQLVALDPAVNAIVSSGYSNDPVIAQFRKHGFRGRLTKPYQISELSQTLLRLRQGTWDDD